MNGNLILNNLGTIFYNYDAIDITSDVNCSLFNNSNYINSGVESLVYDVGDYVYKVKKHGYTLQKDLENQLYLLNEKNEINTFLKEEPVGYLTHLLESSVKHLVTKQKKVNVTTDNYIEVIKELMEQDWIPIVSSYIKDKYVIYDIRPENCGIDEEKNFKIIDCNMYKK